MFWFLIFISISALFECDSFDPDIDICTDPLLDSAVHSDDGNSYIFKGKYFWQTKPLDNQFGIIGFANPITDKWPDITDKVIAAFSFPKAVASKDRTTVFITKDKWISYENGSKTGDGYTQKWPKFPNTTLISAAFGVDYKTQNVFIIFNNSNNYIMYEFSSLDKPVNSSIGETIIRDHSIFFLDEVFKRKKKKKFTNPGDPVPLSTLIDVNAALLYDKSLVFISKTIYCIISLEANPYEKTCDPQNSTEKLLNCPLDITNRPTTTTTLRTTTSTTTTPMTTETTDLSTIQISTTKPIVVETTTTTSIGSTGSVSSTGNGSKLNTDSSKSTLSAIVFIVVLICLLVIIIVIIVIFSKLLNTGTKGTVYYL